MSDGAFQPSDWKDIRLVAFDVDGTLYRQRPLRLRMARDIVLHTLTKADPTPIAVLGRFRRIRERLGEERAEGFEAKLIAETAAASGRSREAVQASVNDWIETRPLPYLAACRYDGVAELFAGLRRHGKTIGVLSDYPAKAKLAALGLTADHIVTAGLPEVGVLKPHPRGLQALMDRAGVAPAATLLIGDRADRDGVAAREARARVLIRSTRPIEGWQTFDRFDAPVFAPMLA
jgi:putative hydrolase of the HAD superfamily